MEALKLSDDFTNLLTFVNPDGGEEDFPQLTKVDNEDLDTDRDAKGIFSYEDLRPSVPIHHSEETVRAKIKEIEKDIRYLDTQIYKETDNLMKNSSGRKRRLQRSYDPLTFMENKREELKRLLFEKHEQLELLSIRSVERSPKHNSTRLLPVLSFKNAEDFMHGSNMWVRPSSSLFALPPASSSLPHESRSNRPLHRIKRARCNSHPTLRRDDTPRSTSVPVGYSSNNGTGLNSEMKTDSFCQSEISDLLRHCKINEDEVILGKLIGKGAYGEVYRGTYRGKVVAIKRLSLKGYLESRHKVLKAFSRELKCLYYTRNCKYIVDFHGAYKNDDYCCLVMEYMKHGSIYDYILKRGNGTNFTLASKLQILWQIAAGMKFIHSRKPAFIHRDLTSHNLLLEVMFDSHDNITDVVCKIADFGIAVEKVKRAGKSVLMSPVGHPRYRAPEVSKNELYSKRADVYNFGTVMYEILCEKQVFHGQSPDTAAANAALGVLPLLDQDIIDSAPPVILDLLARCWNLSPQSRPQFEEILTILGKASAEEQQKTTKDFGLFSFSF
eukprot:TRINITY_DN117_c1_g1_i1.p1 TRINITY_DN117_c1_g1~~TRINITY_DN117_c1_g1_i1.p1  ORF type:complete len:597 (-),score=67.75 TRINITY_DN117_c1_g1_i1:43-1704(-)